jgi:hypothetical protein
MTELDETARRDTAKAAHGSVTGYAESNTHADALLMSAADQTAIAKKLRTAGYEDVAADKAAQAHAGNGKTSTKQQQVVLTNLVKGKAAAVAVAVATPHSTWVSEGVADVAWSAVAAHMCVLLACSRWR